VDFALKDLDNIEKAKSWDYFHFHGC
jgi:hypothetical protein